MTDQRRDRRRVDQHEIQETADLLRARSRQEQAEGGYSTVSVFLLGCYKVVALLEGLALAAGCGAYPRRAPSDSRRLP